jgi:hypothetical protein
MGIRICKRLGYALTDLGKGEYANDETFDSRLVMPPSDFIEMLDENPDARVKRMAAWARKTKSFYRTEKEREDGRSFFFSMLKCQEAWKKDSSLLDYIFHSGDEFGDSSILLFTPISIDEDRWVRHDDLIDHLEFSLTSKIMEEAGFQNKETTERIIEVPYGIYPYEGTFINQKTGKLIPRASGTHFYLMEMAKKMIESGEEEISDIWKEDGFENAQDILDNLKAEVPIEIVVMAKFLGIFKDPMTVHSLKPIIYTYWG